MKNGRGGRGTPKNLPTDTDKSVAQFLEARRLAPVLRGSRTPSTWPLGTGRSGAQVLGARHLSDDLQGLRRPSTWPLDTDRCGSYLLEARHLAPALRGLGPNYSLPRPRLRPEVWQQETQRQNTVTCMTKGLAKSSTSSNSSLSTSTSPSNLTLASSTVSSTSKLNPDKQWHHPVRQESLKDPGLDRKIQHPETTEDRSRMQRSLVDYERQSPRVRPEAYGGVKKSVIQNGRSVNAQRPKPSDFTLERHQRPVLDGARPKPLIAGDSKRWKRHYTVRPVAWDSWKRPVIDQLWDTGQETGQLHQLATKDQLLRDRMRIKIPDSPSPTSSSPTSTFHTSTSPSSPLSPSPTCSCCLASLRAGKESDPFSPCAFTSTSPKVKERRWWTRRWWLLLMMFSCCLILLALGLLYLCQATTVMEQGITEY